MTEAEIRELFNRARRQTSAKEAEVTFVVQDGSKWIILFQSRGEELAIELDEGADSTAQSIEAELCRSLMRLS